MGRVWGSPPQFGFFLQFRVLPFGNLFCFSHSPPPRVPPAPHTPASGSVMAGGTQESRWPHGTAGFSAPRSPSPPEPQERLQTPWDHAVRRQSRGRRWWEGHPDGQEPPSHGFMSGPPITQGWLEELLRGAAASPAQRGFLMFLLFLHPEVARIGTGEAGQASPRVTSRSREAAPAKRPPLVHVLLCTKQPFIAEAGRCAMVPQGRLPSRGCPRPPPQGRKGSRTQQEEGRSLERTAQESLEHPHPSSV